MHVHTSPADSRYANTLAYATRDCINFQQGAISLIWLPRAAAVTTAAVVNHLAEEDAYHLGDKQGGHGVGESGAHAVPQWRS
jgi:hypothetical protein